MNKPTQLVYKIISITTRAIKTAWILCIIVYILYINSQEYLGKIGWIFKWKRDTIQLESRDYLAHLLGLSEAGKLGLTHNYEIVSWNQELDP